jgi:2-oxoglutarate ferredoxin oxidoreductase subunit alpha
MTGDVLNDFCVQAATVNGSGSQSSNLVITKALFHMGIPVAAKNVFPSNIEGEPTWYDIRVTPQGYQARKRTVDILIAMNPATWERDAANVRSGGAVIHEAALPRFSAADRDDVSWYPVPFARLAREKLEAKPDLRKYLQNMIYVGVLAELIGLDPAAVEQGVRDQFRTKPKAADLNLAAVQIGVDYTRENLVKTDPFRVAPMDGTRGTVLLDGNRAAALGSLMAGCTVLAWYPITPSSSLCEAFIDYAERSRVDVATGERRFAAIQAEDELAAIGIVLGAEWAGARAMTATSGPGISLMAELTGLGYYAEIPAVIFDIQRAGPSTGLPTRTMQGDLGFVHTLSHGDTRHPVLLPGTVIEVYEDAQRAFDVADRLQTPVFVLSDLDLGMNLWRTEPLPYTECAIDRGKVLDAKALEQVTDWASPTGPSPAPPTHGRPTSPADRATTSTPCTRRTPTSTRPTWTGSAARSRGRGPCCRLRSSRKPAPGWRSAPTAPPTTRWSRPGTSSPIAGWRRTTCGSADCPCIRGWPSSSPATTAST